ncbi:Uncharacterised protein [Yersinia mollaretii]|nr:Uncharacterised protein [Yersinia mollaretii]CQR09342.1 Uncharacterised protein [Yersinia mollaretii]
MSSVSLLAPPPVVSSCCSNKACTTSAKIIRIGLRGCDCDTGIMYLILSVNVKLLMDYADTYFRLRFSNMDGMECLSIQ